MRLDFFRRGLTCALLILITASFPGSSSAMFKEGSVSVPSHRVIANELIVKFKSKPSSVLMSGCSVTEVRGSNVCKLRIFDTKGRDIRDIAAEFSSDPNVEYAEPNYVFQICVAPNDPLFSKQWGLYKVGASGGWDAKVGDPEIVIAVVDTGIDWDHPDLAMNVWSNADEIPVNGVDDDGNGFIDDIFGWDFVSVPASWVWPGEDPGPEDNMPFDFAGHGTHVAGIAAGHTNNSLGTAGMTWNCKIMPLRAGYEASDGFGYLEYFDAGRAIIYAADNGADVINMSWGGLGNSTFIREAVEYAYNKGCVLVAAAGNVMTEFAALPYYPAAYPQVMAVAATDEDDLLSVWNWYVFSNYGDWVDICAPGTYVLSTIPGNNYGYYSGTSMASPFVAGLAALVKLKFPTFTNDQIVQRIKSTAVNIDAINPTFLKGLLGAGRIDAHRALGSLRISIDYPADGAKVGSKVLIKGYADVENFQSYMLEYGEGDSPDSWLPIGALHTAPVNDDVLESWETPGLSGDCTVRLTVFDTSGESYVADSKVFVSSSYDVDLVDDPLPGPNPFNPEAHLNTKIYYELGSVPAEGVDVDICVYDLTGKLIWKTRKHSTAAGPVTDVYWNGKDAFADMVGNGVYPFLLISDGKIIGRNKIAVIR